MRALLSEAPGGPETLVLRDVADPKPGAGDLLGKTSEAKRRNQPIAR